MTALRFQTRGETSDIPGLPSGGGGEGGGGGGGVQGKSHHQKLPSDSRKTATTFGYGSIGAQLYRKQPLLEAS